MISLWRRRLEKIAQLMWVRASLFAVLGVAAALLAVALAPFVPAGLPASLGSDAVHQILNILASSMLAVTTFSLSVMVASYSSASNNVSPRATRLLREDPTTQNVLAVFLGSFLFSLVGIVALNTGYYSERGRFVLFVFSIGVIGIIVFTMLRWIDHLTRLGRVGETTARVERATCNAIEVRLKTPSLGGNRLRQDQREAMQHGLPVYPKEIGYVAYVDVQALQAAAAKLDAEICLVAMPGSFVHTSRALAVILKSAPSGEVAGHDHEALEKVRTAFEVAQERSYSQDPRFGIAVLAEVASRALSPAINDAGTAIDVLGRGVRLLAPWVKAEADAGAEDASCASVFVPELQTEDMFDDLFTPIARDGAHILEVQLRLQKSLLALVEMGNAQAAAAALRHSQQAFERAEIALDLDADKELLRSLSNDVMKHARDKTVQPRATRTS